MLSSPSLSLSLTHASVLARLLRRSPLLPAAPRRRLGERRARFEGMGVMGREGEAGLVSMKSACSCSGMASSSQSPGASRLRPWERRESCSRGCGSSLSGWGEGEGARVVGAGEVWRELEREMDEVDDDEEGQEAEEEEEGVVIGERARMEASKESVAVASASMARAAAEEEGAWVCREGSRVFSASARSSGWRADGGAGVAEAWVAMAAEEAGKGE